jgi:hypothetical protein
VRRAAFWLTGLSSGFGWLVILLGGGERGVRPVDFNPSGLVMPEAITFLSIYLLPLFALSMALMVAVMCLYLLALERRQARYAVAAGVFFGLLANIHTYDVVTVAGVLIAYAAVEGVRQRRLPRAEALNAALVGLLALPAVVWQWHVIQADLAYREKAILTPTYSLGLADHVISYGAVLLLAAVGFPRVARAGRAGLLAACWLVAGWVLFKWVPSPFQRKLAEGLHIPMCLAAAVGLVEVALPRLARRWRGPEGQADAEEKAHRRAWWAAAGVVALSSISNVAFVRQNLADLVTNNERQLRHAMPPYYLSQEDLQAMAWLEANTGRDEVVLASPWIANYIPGQTGNRVLAGHWDETLGFARLLADVVKPFYDPAAPAETKSALLRQHPITYVYFGPYERILSGGEPLPKMPELRVAYSNAQVTIYRVEAQGGRDGPE